MRVRRILLSEMSQNCGMRCQGFLEQGGQLLSERVDFVLVSLELSLSGPIIPNASCTP